MARATHPGQDHAGDVYRALKCLIAEDQRRDAASHAARVQHQHYRQIQKLRQRGIAVLSIEVNAVVQTVVAFDQAHVGARAMAREFDVQLFGRRQVEVQIAAAAAGRG